MNHKDRITALLAIKDLSTARSDLQACLNTSLPISTTTEDLIKNALKYMNAADKKLEHLILKKSSQP